MSGHTKCYFWYLQIPLITYTIYRLSRYCIEATYSDHLLVEEAAEEPLPHKKNQGSEDPEPGCADGHPRLPRAQHRDHVRPVGP